MLRREKLEGMVNKLERR